MKTKKLNIKSIIPVLVGFLFWILTLSGKITYSFFELSHVETLLIAAPLWLLPLAWNISKKPDWLIWLSLSCGLFFAIAFQLPKGQMASMLIVPWFLLAMSFAIQKIFSLQKKELRSIFLDISLLCETAGYLYLPVGIFWTFIDRLGISILGYDPTIILLTAVHFHYAGFILPQVTSWLLERKNTFFYKMIGLGIILGIPLVAVGISATHFEWPGWVEMFSVSIMTFAGAMVGLLYIRLGIKVKSGFAKICFSLGGFALIIGMGLAFCYGWRHVFVIQTLTIPWMYAVHGTCNAVGFAAPVLIGWKFVKK